MTHDSKQASRALFRIEFWKRAKKAQLVDEIEEQYDPQIKSVISNIIRADYEASVTRWMSASAIMNKEAIKKSG